MATPKTQNKNSLNNSPQFQYLNDESWIASTWAHRACFASGCTTLLITLAKCISLLCGSRTPWLELIVATFIGYLLADLGSGIFHWAVDNYGGPQTPIFGAQIEIFKVHHMQPLAITQRQLARLLHVPSAAVTFAVMPVNVLSGDPVVLGFVFVFSGCVMFSQLFHAWAHTPKGRLPAVVAAFQDAGVVVGRAEHARHHRPRFNSNYCIVSGVWNRLLDRWSFFLGLEFVIFQLVGVKPRSWSDTTSD